MTAKETINLSILDFKEDSADLKPQCGRNYKSIHIGF